MSAAIQRGVTITDGAGQTLSVQSPDADVADEIVAVVRAGSRARTTIVLTDADADALIETLSVLRIDASDPGAVV